MPLEMVAARCEGAGHHAVLERQRGADDCRVGRKASQRLTFRKPNGAWHEHEAHRDDHHWRLLRRRCRRRGCLSPQNEASTGPNSHLDGVSGSASPVMQCALGSAVMAPRAEAVCVAFVGSGRASPSAQCTSFGGNNNGNGCLSLQAWASVNITVRLATISCFAAQTKKLHVTAPATDMNGRVGGGGRRL